MVARQQQMIAVVYDEVEGLIVVRSAAPARGARRLVHDDAEAGLDKTDCCAQAGDAGPDDVDDPSVHMTP